jgi:hypothetical protein
VRNKFYRPFNTLEDEYADDLMVVAEKADIKKLLTEEGGHAKIRSSGKKEEEQKCVVF